MLHDILFNHPLHQMQTPDLDPNDIAASAVITDVPTDIPQPEYEVTTADNSPTHAALVSAILARTVDVLTPAGTPPDLIEPFGIALAEEVDNILRKFAAGQQKHGGDIRDRDLTEELTQEVRDALVYLVCMRLQRLTIRVPIE